MNSQFKKNLFLSTSVSVIILMISSAASFLSIRALLNSNDMVGHTNDVIYALNMGNSAMLDTQTAVRGYLLTGQQMHVDQYKTGMARANYYYDQVANLTEDNPTQQQNVRELNRSKQEFYNYIGRRVAAKQIGIAPHQDSIARGTMLLDEVRNAKKVMEEQEQKLLEQRTTQSSKYGNYSTILIIIAAVIAIIISIVFFLRILKDYNERLKLHVQLQKSEEDTQKRIDVISKIAAQISSGDYDIRVDDTESDALGEVAVSLNNMAGALDSSFKALSEKEWLQTGIAELNTVMLGEKSIEALTGDIIEHIAEYTGSNAGVLYLKQGKGLVAEAGYSYAIDRGRAQLREGEGLPGQAAASGKITELNAGDETEIKISYALGEIVPKYVIAVPLFTDKINGVAELGSLKPYTELQKEFLRQASNNIGIAIAAAQSRKRVQELLEETQAQSEELRVQHSELESMNAELETQAEKLQASEEELRVQQEELQQTNEELAERSVLLEEKNLEIQKKSEDLELSTRYKSEFLANMSHELRTPLNSILLLSRLLSENNEDNMTPEQVEFAKVIQSSGNGLLGLIDEILDLSKIEAGKMDLDLTEVSVNDVTEGMKNLFAQVAKEKGITFNIIADNAPMVIKTDKMRLEQILKNLVSNAIKFTAEGSVTLEVKKSSSNDKMISFAVRDTGIGIPREKQPLIFEAFQQADGSTKRKYGGTGLGLSISRELAKLLKGDIKLYSNPGEGSEFTLTIPIIASSIGMPAEAVQEEMPIAKTEEKKTDEVKNKYLSPSIPDDVPDDRNDINAGDKIILIVEDDVNFAKSLLEFTRKRGYKGVVTVRGDYALNLAEAYKPVGVLLDVQLPMKSGWEVMEDLKGNLATRHIPVHMMSSHNVKRESLLKGAINFLDKPVAYEMMPEIFTRIEHIINKESQKVLIFEDNPKHAKALAYFLESNNINSEIKSEIEEGVDALKKSDIDCVILDMGIPDKQAYEIMENVKKDPNLEKVPVIVFTGKSLSMKEELKIKKYADSIVVKTAHSYQRMLDEVSLFLHLVEEEKKNGKASKRTSQMTNVLNEKTVLIVDDDVRNIFSLTKALEIANMKVITAIDGEEALKMLKEHPETDVVLLDMMMPNMDGYETATRIRKDAKFRNLPVIAVTAKAMTGDREKCINAGASDYITKPVDVDQLMSLLRVWLYDKQ
jgi:signal transduction histidine kinase/CheY-like chemotaxis protein/CHASE3 domain sensor protein